MAARAGRDYARRVPRALGLALLSALAGLGPGCGHAPPAEVPDAAPLVRAAQPAPATVEPAAAAPAPTPDAPKEAAPGAPPVEPVRLKVPGDKPVWIVPGDPQGPTLVYLHGRCGDPHAFVAWAAVGRRVGTIVSLSGDERCKDGHHDKWSGDVVAIDRRATRAIAAAQKELGLALADRTRVAVGYSQGSLMAEALATRFPERYPNVVLIAGPRGPKDDHLKETKAVLIMVGDQDMRLHLREATAKLEARGQRVRYLELPGARHGEYGTEAEARMADGLAWLLADPARPPDALRDGASPGGAQASSK